jgi:hypothetical protein
VSALVLTTVMNAIGSAVAGASGVDQSYTRPTEGIRPPCVVVGYPDELDFDQTFRNGVARAVFPVWVVLGLQQDESTHTALSSLATFAVLEAVADDSTLTALGAVMVEGMTIEGWNIGTDDRPLVHTALRFTVEVIA